MLESPPRSESLQDCILPLMLRAFFHFQMTGQLLDCPQYSIIHMVNAFQIGVIMCIIEDQCGNSLFNCDRPSPHPQLDQRPRCFSFFVSSVGASPATSPAPQHRQDEIRHGSDSRYSHTRYRSAHYPAGRHLMSGEPHPALAQFFGDFNSV